MLFVQNSIEWSVHTAVNCKLMKTLLGNDINRANRIIFSEKQHKIKHQHLSFRCAAECKGDTFFFINRQFHIYIFREIVIIRKTHANLTHVMQKYSTVDRQMWSDPFLVYTYYKGQTILFFFLSYIEFELTSSLPVFDSDL